MAVIVLIQNCTAHSTLLFQNITIQEVYLNHFLLQCIIKPLAAPFCYQMYAFFKYEYMMCHKKFTSKHNLQSLNNKLTTWCCTMYNQHEHLTSDKDLNRVIMSLNFSSGIFFIFHT